MADSIASNPSNEATETTAVFRQPPDPRDSVAAAVGLCNAAIDAAFGNLHAATVLAQGYRLMGDSKDCSYFKLTATAMGDYDLANERSSAYASLLASDAERKIRRACENAGLVGRKDLPSSLLMPKGPMLATCVAGGRSYLYFVAEATAKLVGLVEASPDEVEVCRLRVTMSSNCTTTPIMQMQAYIVPVKDIVPAPRRRH